METLIVLAPLIFLFVIVFYLRRKLFTKHIGKLSQLEKQKVLDKKDKNMKYIYLLFVFLIGQRLVFSKNDLSTLESIVGFIAENVGVLSRNIIIGTILAGIYFMLNQKERTKDKLIETVFVIVVFLTIFENIIS